MITLEALHALHERHGSARRAPVAPVEIGSVEIGSANTGPVTIGDGPVTLMGTINLSRDSTYRESVAVSTEAALRMGRIQVAQGAAILDVGAEASGQGAARVGPQEQIDTLVPVVRGLSEFAVVSVETYRPEVVEACLEAGARVLNMTGREHEEAMLALAARYDAAVVMCFGEAANVRDDSPAPSPEDPMPALVAHFRPRLERARELGADRVVVDPGIGFHFADLDSPLERVALQTQILTQAFRLRELGVPVCTVLPHSYDLFEDEFRKAEGFYAVLAALGGVQMMRVHEIPHVRTVLTAMDTLDV